MPFAEIDPTRGDVVVSTQWTEKEVIKGIPGSSWDSKTKSWHLPLSWGSCVALRGFFKEYLTVGPELTAWSWQYHQTRVEPALRLRQQLTWPSADESPELNWHEPHLYGFQKTGVEFMAYAGDVLLGDEMGTGKTIQTLSALAHRIGPDVTLPALVICPNSVKRHWADKAAQFFPKSTPYVIEGGATVRRKELDRAKDDSTALVIVNIEAVRSFSRLAPYGSIRLKKCAECDRYGDPELKKSSCEVHAKELNGFGFKTVICDEAHRCKDPKSKQTRAWWAVAHDPSVQRRWALTGTPIAQHVGDLWSIMHGVAPYDFPTKSKFIERYGLTSWNSFGGLDVVGVKPDTKDELYAILDPHFRRVTKALVLTQLPPKVRETRYVEMPAAQRKMYDEMAKSLVTVTETGELFLAANQLSAQIRLSQLAAAAVDITKENPDDPSTWTVRLKNPSPKLDEFESVLDDLGEVPCVAAAEHKQLINLASERLTKKKIPHALITGDVSEYERQQALELLKERKIRVLLFTAKAGGTGLDMSAADTIIMLQRPWSMVDNLQAEDRVHRIGSEIHETIRVIDIVTKDTIEEKQVERLYVKLARLEEITRDRAALRAAGVQSSSLDFEEQRILESHLGLPEVA